MQKKNLDSNKRKNGKIKDQPIGELSRKEIEKYLSRNYPEHHESPKEYLLEKPVNKGIQVKEEFSQEKLLKLLGEDLFQEVFVNPILNPDFEKERIAFKEFTSAEEDANCEFMELSRKDRRWLKRKGGSYKDKTGVIVLFSKIKMLRKVIGVIKFEGSKADKTKQAEDIINKAFTSPYVLMELTEKEELLLLASAYGDSTAAGAENTFANLNNGIQSLLGRYQIYANANPEKAKLVFASGKFGIKTITPRKNQQWGVKNTKIEGHVVLRAEGSKVRSAHDWWISQNGKDFFRLCPTLGADTLVIDLIEGQYVYFMHQLITKDGPQGFDLTIRLMVATLS